MAAAKSKEERQGLLEKFHSDVASLRQRFHARMKRTRQGKKFAVDLVRSTLLLYCAAAMHLFSRLVVCASPKQCAPPQKSIAMVGFDPTSIGLPADFVMLDYSKMKG